MVRFYELDAGRITLDDVDVTAMTRNGLRSRMGMVLQDTLHRRGTRPHHHRHYGPLGIPTHGRTLGLVHAATVPAAQLATSVTLLLSVDGSNIHGAILYSDVGRSAL